MTSPSVTYSFSNGTTADATQVNQNFTDVLNALTDGTKSLSIDGLTVAGATALNGSVGLGNATGDDITVTGYLASNLIPKSHAAYGLGDATHGFSAVYGVTHYATTIDEASSTVGVTIDSVLCKDGGVTLASTSGTATALNFYQHDNSSMTSVAWLPNGAGSGLSTATSMSVCRIGRLVNISVNSSILTADPNTGTTRLDLKTSSSGAVALPSWAWPVVAIECPVHLKAGSSSEIGEMVINTDGTMAAYRVPNTSFTVGSNNAGVYAQSFSYICA